jgi:tetratricopeptide (TPR) repeat protein
MASGLQVNSISFELGNVLAQQGDLAQAITLYQEVLANTQNHNSDTTLRLHILAHNNLAYHLHLLEDKQAEKYVKAGLALARQQGALPLLPYLLSTAGEISLAQKFLVQAEAYFNEGLELAERFSAQERVAGLTANLGLVAAEQGQTALAIHRLSTALAQADGLKIHHLGIKIRLWLAPLLPSAQAQAILVRLAFWRKKANISVCWLSLRR